MRFYLLQSPPLLFLLLNALLSLSQQLALVLFLLTQLLLLQELLPAKSLRPLLVLLLQADKVAAQRGLARHVDNGAEENGKEGKTVLSLSDIVLHLKVLTKNTLLYY